jgi:hypothetical protein
VSDPLDPFPKEQPLEDTPRVPQDFGVRPLSDFSDTLFGPKDKTYLDFIARQTTQLRGTNAYYYVLRSQTQRMDGNAPLTDAPRMSPFERKGRADPARVDEAIGISALYGEPVVIGPRVDSLRREVTPTWDYADPVLVRGICHRLQRSENPDQRGTIYIRKLVFDVARCLAEQEWTIQPQPGDVVRLPNLLGSYDRHQPEDSYYDVEAVETNTSKFGATGFFTVFSLELTWQSKYDPQRKFPDRIKTTQPEPPV